MARANAERDQDLSIRPGQQLAAFKTAAAGLLLSAGVLLAPPALADLNKFEANINGEFGTGTSKQYGEAEVRCTSKLSQSLALLWYAAIVLATEIAKTSIMHSIKHAAGST